MPIQLPQINPYPVNPSDPNCPSIRNNAPIYINPEANKPGQNIEFHASDADDRFILRGEDIHGCMVIKGGGGKDSLMISDLDILRDSTFRFDSEKGFSIIAPEDQTDTTPLRTSYYPKDQNGETNNGEPGKVQFEEVYCVKLPLVDEQGQMIPHKVVTFNLENEEGRDRFLCYLAHIGVESIELPDGQELYNRDTEVNHLQDYPQDYHQMIPSPIWDSAPIYSPMTLSYLEDTQLLNNNPQESEEEAYYVEDVSYQEFNKAGDNTSGSYFPDFFNLNLYNQDRYTL